MSCFACKKHKQLFDPQKMPRHVGIIMDGNGRWAKKRGLPRTAGHAVGLKAFKKIAFHAKDIGIEQITFYAFSTENWKRPKNEIDQIMKLLDQYVDEALDEFEQRKVRVRFLGDISPLPPQMVEKMRRLEQLTEHYLPWTINIALNYGGRDEIVKSVQKIAQKVSNGTLSIDKITQDTVAENLYFHDLSECDLIIRPSGEYRLSNFLLWQSAYSEFWFDEILWPDFKPHHLDKAIADFQKRKRRFGAI